MLAEPKSFTLNDFGGRCTHLGFLMCDKPNNQKQLICTGFLAWYLGKTRQLNCQMTLVARTSSSKFTIIYLVALSIIPLINDARSRGISEVYMLLAECSSLRKVNWHPQKWKMHYSKRT